MKYKHMPKRLDGLLKLYYYILFNIKSKNKELI